MSAQTCSLLDEATALAALADQLHRHPLLVVTGAGISTASGIPDYRDHSGVRRGRDPMTYQEFIATAANRQRYWARSMRGWPRIRDARANPAHQVLANLQRQGLVQAVITQNVDGLHQQAGSPAVVDLHGNLHRVVCLDCHRLLPRPQVQNQLEAENPGLLQAVAEPAPDGDTLLAQHWIDGFRLPHCPSCGSDRLKPDVVFFGEGVAQTVAEQARRHIREARALLVIGSTLMTRSSYSLCLAMHERGRPVMALNRGMTRADALLEWKHETACEQFLPRLDQYLREH